MSGRSLTFRLVLITTFKTSETIETYRDFHTYLKRFKFVVRFSVSQIPLLDLTENHVSAFYIRVRESSSKSLNPLSRKTESHSRYELWCQFEERKQENKLQSLKKRV